MDQPRCCVCQRPFAPSRFHPHQAVCSAKPCQQQRRSQTRKRQLATDDEYLQVCRDSSRKWRANHPNYWQQYRATNPAYVQHNRAGQQQRDLRRRLAHLANNNLALDLKTAVSGVWLLGPAAQDLANNNLASAHVFILQRGPRKAPLPEASCKQHPSGLPSAPA